MHYEPQICKKVQFGEIPVIPKKQFMMHPISIQHVFLKNSSIILTSSPSNRHGKCPPTFFQRQPNSIS